MKNYKQLIIYVIIFTLISLIVIIESRSYVYSHLKSEQFHAQNGIMDLKNWDLKQLPILSLDGEWKFYQNVLLNPLEENHLNSEVTGKINVPGLWNSLIRDGKEIGPYNYGTYLLTVLLPQNEDEPLALKIPDMSSSYKLYINGHLVSSNGVVGKSLDEEDPFWKPTVKSLGEKTDRLEIMVHVSNFHHIKGGIWESILLGTEEGIYANRESNLMISFVLTGILFISALYYLIVFSVMQSSKAGLYLAMFSFVAGIRELLIREVVILTLFPNITFNWISKLEYMTVPSGPILLALSVYGLYPKELPKKALYAIITIFLAYIIIIAGTPLRVFAHFMDPCLVLFVCAFIYLIFVIVTAAKNKRPGARTLLFGTVILLLTALIDMGYIYQIHTDYDLAYTFSIGLIIFILCQMRSFTLSVTDVFEKSQQLARTELAFLQAQIVPHFLYNTLNTIIHLTRESPDKARSLLLDLSNYLRGKFNFELYHQHKFLSLEYEMDIVKSYLNIESVRFDDRLQVIYRVEDCALQCKVLPFLLQPLVENAVIHGLRNKPRDCRLIISAHIKDNMLLISIEDNGIGISKDKILLINQGQAVQKGTGLYNVHRRLLSVYGQGLTLYSTIENGTKIEIRIPLESGAGYAQNHVG